jgi:pyridoxal 5'-phosphate synthase pdxS subunit
MQQIRHISSMCGDEIYSYAKEIGAPLPLIQEVKELGKLPVVNFAAGGVATPADAALMMVLGADGVFVGSGIFKSSNPSVMAKAIVEATAHYDDPKLIARVSENLGGAMRGLEIDKIPKEERLAVRGW